MSTPQSDRALCFVLSVRSVANQGASPGWQSSVNSKGLCSCLDRFSHPCTISSHLISAECCFDVNLLSLSLSLASPVSLSTMLSFVYDCLFSTQFFASLTYILFTSTIFLCVNFEFPPLLFLILVLEQLIGFLRVVIPSLLLTRLELLATTTRYLRVLSPLTSHGVVLMFASLSSSSHSNFH